MSEFFEPGTVYVRYEDPYKAPELVPEFWCEQVLQHPSSPSRYAIGWGRSGHGQPWEETPFLFGENHFEAWGHPSPHENTKWVAP